MLSLSKKVALSAIGVALFAAPIAALAEHGQAGLWQITITVNDNNGQMPDLTKLPPDVQARMKAMGASVGGNTISVQHCMTGQEWALRKLPLMGSQDKDCSVSNVSETGNHVSADLTCSGDFSGTGHVESDWDSDEHYTSEVTMTGSHDGKDIRSSERIEGRLLSDKCDASGQ